MLRFGFRCCDCCHRLLFEYPIIFWTPCAAVRDVRLLLVGLVQKTVIDAVVL
jgi:hypothetical protein